VKDQPVELEFDTNDKLSIAELRTLIVQEIYEWNPALKAPPSANKRSRSNTADVVIVDATDLSGGAAVGGAAVGGGEGKKVKS
jgi:hypothetical protein